jgi:hypothetical protein
LEFDYISTTRPPPDQQPVSNARLFKMLDTVGMGANFARQVLDPQAGGSRLGGGGSGSGSGVGGMRNARTKSLSINTTLLEFHMMASSEEAFFTTDQVSLRLQVHQLTQIDTIADCCLPLSALGS